MEQLKEKSKWQETNSLLTFEHVQKEYFNLGRIIKEEECNINDDIGGEWHYPKGIYNKQIDRAVKAKNNLILLKEKFI